MSKSEDLWQLHSAALGKSLWDESPELSLLVDGEKILDARGPALAVLGTEPDKLKGLPLSSLEPGAEQVRRAMGLERELLGSPGIYGELAVRRVDGSPGLVSLRVHPLGEGLTLLRMTDVGQQAQLTAELRRVHQQLQQAFVELKDQRRSLDEARRAASLSHFAAGLAHELNNPVSILTSNAHTLKEYAEDIEASWPKGSRVPEELAELPQIVAEIAQSGARVAEVVRCLLELERPGRREPMDVAEVVLATVAGFGEVKVEAPEHLEAHSDRQAIARLLRPVLDNARKAAGAGAVRVEVKRVGDRFELWIFDDGPGIPAEFIDRVFDPFFSTRPPGSGLGLGLFLARRAASVLGGELTLVESSRGATFKASLPLQMPESPVAKLNYEQLRTQKSSQ